MGNKKNRINRKYSTHKSKSIYIKKRIPTKIKKSRAPASISQPTPGNNRSIGPGCQIVSVNKLLQYTEDVAAHATQCEGPFALTRERRDGLASTFSGECPSCRQTITLETSEKVKGPRDKKRLVCVCLCVC